MIILRLVTPLRIKHDTGVADAPPPSMSPFKRATTSAAAACTYTKKMTLDYHGVLPVHHSNRQNKTSFEGGTKQVVEPRLASSK